VDTNLVKLTPDQMQNIDRVRQTFMAELGTNQDVNSPEYFNRWQAAQEQADELMVAFLGLQAKLDYEAAVQSQRTKRN
jgi:predicted transglutaminase-like cysteine proteinase